VKNYEIPSFHFQPSLKGPARNDLPKQRSHRPPPHNLLSPPSVYSSPFFVSAADPEIKLELGDRVDFTGIRPQVPTDESNMLRPEPTENTPSVEQLDGEESDTVLDKEKANATNTHIYANNMTLIRLKRIVSSSYDEGKQREEMEWEDYPPIEVSTKDPHGNVMVRMRSLFRTARLRPYNRDLRALTYQDCYKVAQDDDDHTLYLMPVNEGFLENRKLVEAGPDDHRDKVAAVGRGMAKTRARKVGLSFYYDEPHRIRRAPDGMRIVNDSQLSSPAAIKNRRIATLKTVEL
jgi:hypothetical protein